jgi:VWFA-related protein
VRQAARQFLERHFTEGDLAAVVHTQGTDDLGQGLTGNRALLLAAVDRFLGRKLQSSTINRIQEYYRTQDIRRPEDPINDPEATLRAQYARNTLQTLENVVEWLGGIHGRRKAVLFIGEGIDYDTRDAINNREATDILTEQRRATAAATSANVSFYTLDPRGLGGLSSEMMEIQPVVNDDPALGLNTQGLDSELRRSQDNLRELADETSGLAAVSTNDFAGAFDRVVKDSSAYYLLGYHSPSPKRDGRPHKLEVKVSRPGLRVRARNGYTAPRGKPADTRITWARKDTPAALVDLLRAPMAQPGLPMMVQAAAFRGQPGHVSVMVATQVGPQAFRFTEKDGSSQDTLELSVAAVDTTGRVFGADNKVLVDAKPRTRQLIEAGGFRIVSWLDLVPGRYQVRVAGRAVNSGAAGSVYYDVEAPDFTKEPLALSGIAVTSLVARALPTAGDMGLLKDVLPGAPTTWRLFHPADTLSLVAEVYDGEEPAHSVDVVTSVVAGDGTVAYSATDERKVPARVGKEPRPAVLHTAQVPLSGIPPGTYTLRVKATSRMGSKPPSVERSLVIEVDRPQAPPGGGGR